MNTAALPSSVRRITFLSTDSSGTVVPVTLYEKSKNKKKSSRAFRPLDKAVRRVADAAATYAGSYADRHRKSSQKRRDGWIRDINTNMMRASRKGAKRLKVSRILMP